MNMDGVKTAWHDHIGDAPVDDIHKAKLCAFLAGWEACVAKHGHNSGSDALRRTDTFGSDNGAGE